MSRRHSRQRSNASVKKRSSVVPTNDDDGDIHDNALNSKDNTLSTTESAEPEQDHVGLGPPYPGAHNGSGSTSVERTNINELHSDSGWSAKEIMPIETNTNYSSLDELTTRTELNPYEDGKRQGNQSSTSTLSSQIAPRVPSKGEFAPLPIKKVRPMLIQSSSSYACPTAFASTSRIIPSRQHSFSGTSSTPSSLTVDRRMSLLAGGSLLDPHAPGSSPLPSASSTRSIMTPTSALHRTSSPAKKMQPVKRMSLSYVPSPVMRTKFSGSMRDDSTTTSAVGTSPVPSSSTSGAFARLQDSNPSTPRLPSTGSVVENAYTTSPSAIPARSVRREDGETVMTQHMDILGKIAHKERRILDLKETLQKEERDLRQLQKEWQTSVNRELIASRPETVQINGQSASTRAEEYGTTGIDHQDRRIEVNTAPATAAADGWKAISARLAGAGNQFNAFIDQLAAPLPEEGRRSEDTAKVNTAGLGLDVLREEAEEGDVMQGRKRGGPSAPPSKVSSNAGPATSRQTKRASVFGNSMAVLQKQVEAQFGVVDNKKHDTTTNGDVGGWGTWQKRLKEARENATGLLAKAEAKIGQALTMDDIISNGSNNAASSSGPGGKSALQGSPLNLEKGNDREKAALAELSWLNSLAGINMSGTTDRVVTSRSPEIQPATAITTTTTTKMLQQNDASAEQDIPSSHRKTSIGSRRKSSQSSQASTSRMTSTTSATTVTSGSHSPVHSSVSNGGNGEKGSKEQSSFLSMISSGWSPDVVDDKKLNGTATSHKRLPSNGHSKTRIAAEIALHGRSKSSHPPAQDHDANGEADKAWGL